MVPARRTPYRITVHLEDVVAKEQRHEADAETTPTHDYEGLALSREARPT